jgi:hypothetical protein
VQQPAEHLRPLWAVGESVSPVNSGVADASRSGTSNLGLVHALEYGVASADLKPSTPLGQEPLPLSV